MTEEKMRMRLLVYIRETYGSQKDAAVAWGVTPQQVSKMITGKGRITDNVLEEMGYEQVKLVEYRKRGR